LLAGIGTSPRHTALSMSRYDAMTPRNLIPVFPSNDASLACAGRKRQLVARQEIGAEQRRLLVVDLEIVGPFEGAGTAQLVIAHDQRRGAARRIGIDVVRAREGQLHQGRRRRWRRLLRRASGDDEGQERKQNSGKSCQMQPSPRLPLCLTG